MELGKILASEKMQCKRKIEKFFKIFGVMLRMKISVPPKFADVA